MLRDNSKYPKSRSVFGEVTLSGVGVPMQPPSAAENSLESAGEKEYLLALQCDRRLASAIRRLRYHDDR
jgi:hypothetical protein